MAWIHLSLDGLFEIGGAIGIAGLKLTADRT